MRRSLVLSLVLLTACGGGSSDGDDPGLSPIDPAPGSGPDNAGPAPGPGTPGDPATDPDTDMAPGTVTDPVPGGGAVEGDGSGPVFETPTAGTIDASNYVTLTEFALRMNLLRLSERRPSPAGFLDDFPGGDENALDGLPEGVDGMVGAEGDCPLGGGYMLSGQRDGDGALVLETLRYERCAADAGTLSGRYERTGGIGGVVVETYDLALERPDGTGETVFRASYETGRFESLSFDIGAYSSDADPDAFAVDGSGNRRLDLVSSGSTPVYSYGTDTTIRLSDASGPLELAVETSDLTVAEDGPIRGTMTISVPDGSRVELGVSDAPGSVSLTLVDDAGDRFDDSVSWDEIYRPSD